MTFTRHAVIMLNSGYPNDIPVKQKITLISLPKDWNRNVLKINPVMPQNSRL